MKKSLTPELAYPKIKHYCGYSERCHYEVREKLFGMGLAKKDVETLLSRLIEENYLNEERLQGGISGRKNGERPGLCMLYGRKG